MTIPLLAFRLFAPNGVFPITYRRGRSAHLDVTGARGVAIRRGLEDQLGLEVAFVESRPPPWRQAVDLANMMLCLALRSDPRLVYQRAQRQFSVEEITDGFAATRGLALPSQLRRMLRAQGRDLHAEFTRLLPTPPPPIRIQRWILRRIGLWAVAVVLVVFIMQTIAEDRQR